MLYTARLLFFHFLVVQLSEISCICDVLIPDVTHQGIVNETLHSIGFPEEISTYTNYLSF